MLRQELRFREIFLEDCRSRLVSRRIGAVSASAAATIASFAMICCRHNKQPVLQVVIFAGCRIGCMARFGAAAVFMGH